MLLVAVAPSVEAEQLIRHGVELRRKGQDEAALRDFQRANEIAPSGRATAQIGLAEQALERWVDAEEHLSEALRAKTDPWIQKNRTVLEDSLRTVSGHVARLVIRGQPEGAEAFLDGHNVGRVPLEQPVRVKPGPVRVELRAAGYLAGSTTITAVAGQERTAEVRLERERPTAEPATTKLQVFETPPPPPPESSHPLRTWRRVALGATAVFLTGGVGGLVFHELKVRDFNDRGCRGGDPDPQPACKAILDDASTGKTVAVVGFVGAGVLALTSSLLYFAF